MNKNKLQQYYPIIRTREAVLADINSRPGLLAMFHSWEKEVQEYFLDFVTGVKGIKTLYDTTFKEVPNPETVPERLNFFLSCLLREKVKVLRVLPLDNSRLADETSLVIMDIVVQLSDGRIINVEIQKVGYLFPGQRCACYSSDLLLRQYKAARACLKNHFHDLHSPFCGIFAPHSVDVARYASFIRDKSPTNCEAHLMESLF